MSNREILALAAALAAVALVFALLLLAGVASWLVLR